ncbi:hypothetical protein TSTA_074500 [Talaromyces stipitatus ATCC 10500]|uniref:Uncharacterized protein n=1 Tax=Talaromyces stipitatus (strain ATCC 10500 / CBS 375.48 / QM 6759 / NRRL 1006) TaxID=441959 RepID=B8LW44_TALSN|nr:uncharacterized protein TSTA_074500 [Talaromyces stipitatus ATCC 10500]EED24072.1 hypothetical protein TSTA_074500 [Talaromyces stipitatus ATCC 10500]
MQLSAKKLAVYPIDDCYILAGSIPIKGPEFSREKRVTAIMVSVKALFALYAISDIANSYPIHRHIDDFSSESHHLTPRSPNPRFKNPFDVDHYLADLDYKIPNNKDIQEWVKEARKKGALAAEGKLPDDGDGEEEDHDDDESDIDDDDDEDEDGHKHEHTTESSPRSNNNDNKDEEEEEEEDDDDDEVAQPVQGVQPSRPATTHGSAPSDIPSNTATVTVIPTSGPTHGNDDEDGIKNDVEVMQPAQNVQPSQPSTKGSSTPTTTLPSTATASPSPRPGNENGDNEDDLNEVMQPAQSAQQSQSADALDPSTSFTPSNTITGAGDATAPTQTVYVPVNVFPTRFPDIDEDENPSPSSTPLPIFPPPEDITKANLPPAAVPPSPQDATNTNVPEASEALVAQTTTTGIPDNIDAPAVNEESSNDDLDSTPTASYTNPQLPSYESQFAKIKHFLDLFTPTDESEKSYRK